MFHVAAAPQRVKTAGLWPVCLPARHARWRIEGRGLAAGEERKEKWWEEEWFLSTEADWEAVPLSAPPGVAVILRVRVSVCMSAVGQNGVVDQRRVVEALRVELGSVLRKGGEKREGKKKI